MFELKKQKQENYFRENTSINFLLGDLAKIATKQKALHENEVRIFWYIFLVFLEVKN